MYEFLLLETKIFVSDHVRSTKFCRTHVILPTTV